MTRPEALSPEATRMFSEAGEAARVVERQLAANAEAVAAIAARLRADPPRAVVTCGRGSSDHAATFAKYLIETRAGVLTSSAALSVSSVYAAPQDLSGVLYLAISQSGKSPDLLAAVEAAKAGGAFVTALVNDEASPLAALADAVLPLHAGPELSVAATKSYIAALSAIVQLVAAWTGDEALTAALADLPAGLAQAWEQDWSAGAEALRDATNLYVLGRGVGFGIAQEAALKFKETCGLHAEAFSAAEVLHGPMALVKDGFPVLVLAQHDETFEPTIEMARGLAVRGATVLLTADEAIAQAAGATALPATIGHAVLEPILAVQSFYRMAAALSVARGYDPDRPPHLNKVTKTV